jgi:hypothetical protein
VGTIGLLLDILGVWLLAEGLLLSDEDAAFLSTHEASGKDYLLRQRDRQQAQFGLTVATVGFIAQLLGLWLSLTVTT